MVSRTTMPGTRRGSGSGMSPRPVLLPLPPGENCAYNEQGRSCSASHIKVDGKRAQCTGETSCSTFKQKNCC